MTKRSEQAKGIYFGIDAQEVLVIYIQLFIYSYLNRSGYIYNTQPRYISHIFVLYDILFIKIFYRYYIGILHYNTTVVCFR